MQILRSGVVTYTYRFLANFPLIDQYFQTASSKTLNTRNCSNADNKMQNNKWTPHRSEEAKPRLHLMNSLTRNKEPFEPISGNLVKFYICGPTVYDSAHMGHARAYLSFDIVRRVLTDYFNYDVLYVMNITDIDDKIIKRARQNYLFEQYLNEIPGMNHQQLAEQLDAALEHFRGKARSEPDPDKKKLFTEMADKFEAGLSTIRVQLLELDGKEQYGRQTLTRDFLESAKDVIADWLDLTEGHTVAEHSVFTKLARKFENDFLRDMRALNVREPDVLTRVSEHIPGIIDYVQKLIDNGYAYATAGGSVYFDTRAFSSKHSYAKLLPEAYKDADNAEKHLREGEGELSVGPQQCEAYTDSDHWVNYFLHCGTLRIEGLKMSKSLKNFITIKEALRKYTARQLRLLFLLHNWSDNLDYSESTMDHALFFERFSNEFLLNVKDVMRKQIKESNEPSECFSKFMDEEVDLLNRANVIRAEIHAALCDSIDTRTVVERLRALITLMNVYMMERQKQCRQPNCSLLANTANYVIRLLSIFGVETNVKQFDFAQQQQQSSNNVQNMETLVMPFLKVIVDFREEVRVEARLQKNIKILKECDRLRDEVLPELGVRLEDHTQDTCVKLVGREELMREREQKEAMQRERVERKMQLDKEKEQKRLAKEEQKRKQREAATTAKNKT